MTLVSTCNAYVNSGGDATKSASRKLLSRVKNVASTVSISTVEYLTNNDTGLDAVALTHVVNGTSVDVKFAGITGDSMAVTGTSISYT